jgi:hypothetical protein
MHTDHHISGNLSVVHALATFALESDVSVAKNLDHQVVHGWLLESAVRAGFACEGPWSTNFLVQEFSDIYRVNEYEARLELRTASSSRAPTDPSSPHKNRPGMHLHLM